jgi:hypothetical protein
MFEPKVPDPAVAARIDEHIERCCPSTTAQSAALIDRICAAGRAENRAAAAQLVAIGELFGYRLTRCSDTEEWRSTRWRRWLPRWRRRCGSVSGRPQTRCATPALRERLPKVGALFQAGEIGFHAFATIVYRTDLIEDREVLAAVDAQVAVKVPVWPSLTKGRLSAQVDRIVVRVDADAVRRRKERAVERDVWISDVGDDLSEIHGRLFTPEAQALDARLTAGRRMRRTSGATAANIIW